MAKNSDPVVSFVVLGSDGLVDVEASTTAFQTALINYAAKQETITNGIRNAVDSVLKVSQGRVSMSSLVGMTVVKLQMEQNKVYDAKEFAAMSKEVEKYVKANTCTDEDSNRRYVAQKGKGGGYSLNTPDDAPVVEPEHSPDDPFEA